MKIQLYTDKLIYSFNDTIKCTVASDDGPSLTDDHGRFYFAFKINGRTVYYEDWSGTGSNMLQFQQLLWDYKDRIGQMCEIDFQVEIRLGYSPDKICALSPPVRLTIDLTDIEFLRTSSKEPSCYIRHKNKIYFIWPGSRGHAKHHRVVSADPATARPAGDQDHFPYYLVDTKNVFRDGVLIKGIHAESFRIYNRVFAGDKQIIFTPYGNAKVLHPEFFEALDDGNCYYLKTNGEPSVFGAGYGRDDVHVYWFDGSNSTPHAVVVRACKTPRSFVSLDHGYGRDEDSVYFEGRRIKGADPVSWEMLNRLYSRDNAHVYYFTEKVESADVDTFEIVEEQNKRDLFDSTKGRDREHVFDAGQKIK